MIMYTSRDESFDRHTASAQYFLQLAGYLGIPVIAWNADNSGLEQVGGLPMGGLPGHPRHRVERRQLRARAGGFVFPWAGYLGIPVIAWNADNSGLEQVRA